MDMYATQLRSLAGGHGFFVLCAAFYLAWWFEFFRPRGTRPQGAEYAMGVALIVCAVVFGLFATIRICTALGSLPTRVPGTILWPCAIVAYAVLAVVTWRVLGRPITTELVLIVAWTALEIAVVGALASTGSGLATPLLVLAVLGFLGSMVCYLLYYHLSGWAAFLDGCGPLVAVGVISLVAALAI